MQHKKRWPCQTFTPSSFLQVCCRYYHWYLYYCITVIAIIILFFQNSILNAPRFLSYNRHCSIYWAFIRTFIHIFSEIPALSPTSSCGSKRCFPAFSDNVCPGLLLPPTRLGITITEQRISLFFLTLFFRLSFRSTGYFILLASFFHHSHYGLLLLFLLQNHH